MKKIKAKLLTYLFTDWVKSETDVETLIMTRNMIEQRKNKITGHTQVLGFRMHGTTNIK